MKVDNCSNDIELALLIIKKTGAPCPRKKMGDMVSFMKNYVNIGGKCEDQGDTGKKVKTLELIHPISNGDV